MTTVDLTPSPAPLRSTDHEWLEVGNRRWCLGCGQYQVRRLGAWKSIPLCPRCTPYAVKADEAGGTE